MDKIIQTFKNLYSGENVLKKHLMYLLILLAPAFSTTAFNMIDKNNREFWIFLIMLGVCFGIIAIPMAITALGVFVKFIHNKFQGVGIFPEVDMECLKKGFKALPLFLVWLLYYLSVFVIYVISMLVVAYAMGLSKENIALMLVYSGIVLLALAALVVGIFLVYPFVQLIFVKFAQDYKYKAEYFNPITPFKYMAGNFKALIILALKYVLVSFIANIAVYLIVFIVAVFVGIAVTLAFGGQLFSSNQTAYMILVYLNGALSAWTLSYVSGVICLAYADNMTEYYLSTLDKPEDMC